MLGRTFETVLPFAQDLAEKRIVLSTNPSSALNILVGASAPTGIEQRSIQSDNRLKSEINNFGMDLEYYTHPVGGGQLWGAAFNNHTKILVDQLRGEISYIRNVISPRVVEFTESANEFVRSLGSTNPAEQLDIVKFELPELVEDPLFVSLLEQFKTRSIQLPSNTSLIFPFKMIPSDFLEVTKTGNSRLDGLVRQWSNGSGANYLEKAWYSFFAGTDNCRTYKGQYLLQEDMKSTDYNTRLHTALAYFLLANFYWNNRPDVVLREPAAVTKERLFSHVLFAGTTLIDLLKRVEINDKTERMVMSIDTNKKRIVVFKPVYLRWLNAGGSNEVILGNLVAPTHFYTVNEINRNTEALKKTWANYVRVYRQTMEYRKAETMKTFYRGHLSAFLSNKHQDPIEECYLRSRGAHTDKVKAEAAVYLDKLSKDQLLDTQTVSLKLIAGLKYDFTNAEWFMNEMVAVAKTNKDASPQEVGFLVTVKYIVDHLSGQITLSKG